MKAISRLEPTRSPVVVTLAKYSSGLERRVRGARPFEKRKRIREKKSGCPCDTPVPEAIDV
ncbi:MAG TPA: hypothetical protein VIX63_08755 [Vicinamibacterales bacterium]